MFAKIKKVTDTIIRIVKSRNDLKMTKEQRQLALKIAIDVVTFIEISSKGDSELKKVIFTLFADVLKSKLLDEDK